MLSNIKRRAVLGGAVAAATLRSGAARSQQGAAPIKIGLISDMSGIYSDTGGPGHRVAVAMAIEDFGPTLLGRPIQVLQVDGQNKADIASSVARDMIDNQGVTVLADGASSSSGLAIQQIAREKKRAYLITGPASSDFTGKACSPYGIQFIWDSYALAHASGGALTRAGKDRWFFISADYAFGAAMERDASAAIVAAGGRVLGSVRAPVGTSDFSSFLLQAQGSQPQVIALAVAGTDVQNCIKQAAEFGVTNSGVTLAPLVLQITDLVSIGHAASEGLVITNSFYWNMSDASRAWAKRYIARMNKPPTEQHAGTYCGVLHWLKAVKAAGTVDADTVISKMKATPVNDFYNKDVVIRADGRVMHEMYLWKVKPAAAATSSYDFCELLSTIPPSEAWRPMDTSECTLSGPH